jgi:hypothetical protein
MRKWECGMEKNGEVGMRKAEMGRWEGLELGIRY